MLCFHFALEVLQWKLFTLMSNLSASSLVVSGFIANSGLLCPRLFFTHNSFIEMSFTRPTAPRTVPLPASNFRIFSCPERTRRPSAALPRSPTPAVPGEEPHRRPAPCLPAPRRPRAASPASDGCCVRPSAHAHRAVTTACLDVRGQASVGTPHCPDRSGTAGPSADCLTLEGPQAASHGRTRPPAAGALPILCKHLSVCPPAAGREQELVVGVPCQRY